MCDPPAEISRSEQPDMSHIHFAPQCGSLCSWSGGPSGSVNNRVNVRETERGATAGTLFDSGFRLQQPSLVIRLFFFFSSFHSNTNTTTTSQQLHRSQTVGVAACQLLVDVCGSNNRPMIVKTLRAVVLRRGVARRGVWLMALSATENKFTRLESKGSTPWLPWLLVRGHMTTT